MLNVFGFLNFPGAVLSPKRPCLAGGLFENPGKKKRQFCWGLYLGLCHWSAQHITISRGYTSRPRDIETQNHRGIGGIKHRDIKDREVAIYTGSVSESKLSLQTQLAYLPQDIQADFSERMTRRMAGTICLQNLIWTCPATLIPNLSAWNRDYNPESSQTATCFTEPSLPHLLHGSAFRIGTRRGQPATDSSL